MFKFFKDQKPVVQKVEEINCDEIVENFYCLESFINVIFSGMADNLYYLKTQKVEIKVENILQLFHIIYNDTKKLNKYSELDIYINKFDKKLLHTLLDIRNDNPNRPQHIYRNYTESIFNSALAKYNFPPFFIKYNYSGYKIYEENVIDSINMHWNDWENTFIVIEEIKYDIFFEILRIIRVLIAYRNISVYRNQGELVQLSDNLSKQFGYSYINKLFPIYKQYYLNTFSEIYSENNLKLICSIERRWRHASYQEFMDRMDSNSCNILFELQIVTFSEILQKMKKHIENNFSYMLDFDTEKWRVHIELIYKSILNSNISAHYISFTEYLQLSLLKNEFLEQINVFFQQLKMDKEKRRFLAGDFTIEKEIELARITYSNIETGIDFEIYLENLYGKLGYSVVRTKSTRDQGADLILSDENEKIVVQAKFYKGTVGNSAIQEVVAAIKFYSANRGIVITNSTFTRSAFELAAANDIELIDFVKLEDLKERINANIHAKYYKNC